MIHVICKFHVITKKKTEMRPSFLTPTLRCLDNKSDETLFEQVFDIASQTINNSWRNFQTSFTLGIYFVFSLLINNDFENVNSSFQHNRGTKGQSVTSNNLLLTEVSLGFSS